MRGIRGKKVRAVKEGTLIATVDIGMTTNTGYCTTIDGRDIKPFKFDNSREGFEKFLHMIVASKNRFGCTEIMVGYESTGPYAEPLAQYLMDLRLGRLLPSGELKRRIQRSAGLPGNEAAVTLNTAKEEAGCGLAAME
jgi:hypothetical protein